MTIHAVGSAGGTGGAGDASEATLLNILAELLQKTEPANQQHVIIDSGVITTLPAITFASPQAVTGPLTDTQLRLTPVPVSGTFYQVTQPVSLATVPSHDVTNVGIFAVQAAQSGTWNIGTVTTLPAITFASPQHVILDSGTVTSNAGTNLNTSLLALEATQADVRTAVQVIDNFISGSRGLVTEDNSAAILTATNLQATAIKQEPVATSTYVWTTEGARAPFSQTLDGRTRIINDASPFIIDALTSILLELRVMTTVLHTTLNSRDDLDTLRRDALPTLN